MDSILVKGGTELAGEIPIAGAKNACLTLMPATLLSDGPLTLTNAPRLSDIRTMTELLGSLGTEVTTLQDGQVLATGKFGEAEGCHAIRLRDPALAATDDGMVPVMGQAAAMMAAHAPGDLSQPDPFRAQGLSIDDLGLATGTDLTALRG